jgi:hypothetical protein
MPPEKIDSLADDVKPLVLELLRQISGPFRRASLGQKAAGAVETSLARPQRKSVTGAQQR